MGNSVIYRPVYDAEVEYLESTGSQYLDTGVYPNSATSFELKETLVSGRFMFGCWDGDSDNAIAYIITGEASATGILFYRNVGTTNNMMLNYDCGGLHTYSFRNKKLYVDNVELGDLPIQIDTERLEHSIYLFNRNANGGPTLEQPTNARVHSFQVTEDGVLVRDFIPVRIGSVGYMYDKVSKQLFANKGTGQFILGNDVSNAVIPQQRCVLYFGNQRSVGFERIYEEYEWLVGDGSAYIDTLQIFDSGDIVETRVMSTASPSTNRWKYLYGNSSGTTSGTLMMYHNANNQYVFRPGEIPCSTTINSVYKIKHSLTSIEVNGVTISSISQPYVELSKTITIFTAQFTGNPELLFNGLFGYFKLSNKINLTPCRLLRPLPAILDANGIARDAGECGMWDKVNDKFYGNVANSGSFTVSND